MDDGIKLVSRAVRAAATEYTQTVNVVGAPSDDGYDHLKFDYLYPIEEVIGALVSQYKRRCYETIEATALADRYLTEVETWMTNFTGFVSRFVDSFENSDNHRELSNKLNELADEIEAIAG